MQPALLLRRGEHCHRDSRSQAGGLSANTRLQRTLPAAGDFLRPPERSWAALAGGVAQCPSTTPPTHSMQWQGEDFSSLGCVSPPAASQRQRKISPGTSACSELTAEQRGLWHSQPQPPQLNPALATPLHKHYRATSPHRKLPAPCYTSNCSALALKEQKIKKKESSNCCCMCHSPDCVLVCAAASESWVLQGLSHPVRLRDCRPRHRSLVSGRPREDSCVDVGKSILLATASSESWKSAQIENKQKLESSGLLFFRKEFSEALSPKAGLALL